MIVRYSCSFVFLLLLVSCNIQLCNADIGLLFFWAPELYKLLETIRAENEIYVDTIETYVFGARKFYVTKYRGHNVVAVNTGVGISNAAATTAIMLQKFPTIDRIVGSGIAGGVDPDLRVGDVTIPSRWALYQQQHFIKEVTEEDGSVHHEIPNWQSSYLMGDECGDGFGPESPNCDVGVNTWNYTWIYPASVEASDPTQEGDDATIENYGKRHWWFNVDEEMLAVATKISSNITLVKETSNAVLDYQPNVTTGGNGISGPTFVDNANFREYAFNSFEAKALDMESAAAAHVAEQFGKKFIFIRSLSDLAGADQDGNVMGVFFSVATTNAVMTMSKFLEELPIANSDSEASESESLDSGSSDEEDLPTPVGFYPGEDDSPLLAVLSFWQPELDALKRIMKNEDGEEGEPRAIVFGGRKFYRGKIHGADVVAVLTGVGISNAAMSTALLLELFPGIERIVGGGIAGGVNPDFRVGDVTIPSYWSLYQNQLYAKEVEKGVYEPPPFELPLIVGENCGGSDGIGGFLAGDKICNVSAGEGSNFGFMFPKSVQTPDPNDPEEINRIAEGPTRNWRFEVDPEMYQVAKELFESGNFTLKNEFEGAVLYYNPMVHVGGGGVSGSTWVDNAEYRNYVFDSFGDITCLDMGTAAFAHIAHQNGVKFLFFRSLSDLAGADQDFNVMSIFDSIAAENAFSVTSTFIEALYPNEIPADEESDDSSVTSASKSMDYPFQLIVGVGFLMLICVW